MVDSIKLLSVGLLIVATAFFVAAEFAFVKVRVSRIDQLVSEGVKKAGFVKRVLDDLDGYLSACQVGITITALALGWLGEETVQFFIHPLISGVVEESSLSHGISFVLAFAAVTFLHVVFGEMAPKTISIQRAESVSMNLAYPMIMFYKIMYPLIWILNRSANAFVSMIGYKPATEHEESHSEEEIKLIVSASPDINADEKEMMGKIFDFDETVAREIMVHRTEMTCIFIDDSAEETLNTIKGSRHSRFPVCGHDRDDIRGYLNIKDLYGETETLADINLLMRQVPRVQESTPIKRVLKKLQKEKNQLAIVLDEYGGVSGLVTMEDIMEELVGDIQDEYDDEEPMIQPIEDGYRIDGSTHVDDVYSEIGVELEEIDGIDSIGGYIMAKLQGQKPEVGLILDTPSCTLILLETNEERVLAVQLQKKPSD